MEPQGGFPEKSNFHFVGSKRNVSQELFVFFFNIPTLSMGGHNVFVPAISGGHWIGEGFEFPGSQSRIRDSAFETPDARLPAVS